MRPRSVTGPVLLVLIGSIFLVNNFFKDVTVWSLLREYWPMLLIAIGVIGLVEALYYAGRGTQNPPRPLAGAGVFWVVMVVAFATWAGGHSNISIGPFTNGGIDLLGSEYSYDVAKSGTASGVNRVVLDNLHGTLSVTGEDGGDVKITGRKTIRAFSKGEADQADQQSAIQFEQQGDLLYIRVDEPKSSRTLGLTSNLDIAVPRGLNVETRGRTDDLTVDNIEGEVDVRSGRGDVRLSRIGKDVHVESSRGGAIRVRDLKGRLEIQGSGSDVQLDGIQGETAVNGEFGGTLEFHALAKPIHFRSDRSDFRAEAIPGTVTIDLRNVAMMNVTGPVRYKSGTRDIDITNVTSSLELVVDRGDIHVTETKVPLPRMDVHSGHGDVTLTIPGNAGFDLTAMTKQGELSNEFGDELKSTTEGRGGTIRGKQGTGPELIVGTTRGSMAVKKNESAPDTKVARRE